ncbi:MAG: hypothetical protein NVS3B5_02250 [Sphingomicrobium sp.]
MAPPLKIIVRDQIIAEVLEKHAINLDDLTGRCRDAYLVEARMDAAHRLRAADFLSTQIGKILKRDHTTILHYLSEDKRTRKIRTLRLSRFKWMAPDVKDQVIEIAMAEDADPGALVAGWIAERARYEIEARSRAERSAA